MKGPSESPLQRVRSRLPTRQLCPVRNRRSPLPPPPPGGKSERRGSRRRSEGKGLAPSSLRGGYVAILDPRDKKIHAARSLRLALGLPPDSSPPGSRQHGEASVALLLGEEEKATAAVAKDPGPALDGAAAFPAVAPVFGISHSLNTRTSSATCLCFCVCICERWGTLDWLTGLRSCQALGYRRLCMVEGGVQL